MNNSGFDRKLFITATCALALLLAFALGFYSAETRNGLYYGIKGIFSDVEQGIVEAPNLVKPVHFLQPARFPGEGVTVNTTRDDDWILMAGFFDGGNEIRLIRRDGEIVQRGNHASLSAVPGVYQHLCSIQGAIQQQIEHDIAEAQES